MGIVTWSRVRGVRLVVRRVEGQVIKCSRWHYRGAGSGIRPLAVLLTVGAAVLALSCLGGKCHLATSVDLHEFQEDIKSPSMMERMQSGVLTPGMPYLVAEAVFASCGKSDPVLVAASGSKDEIRDPEGWGRRSHDPHLKLFYVEHNTDHGNVAIWYGLADFYRMGVKANDTLIIFQGEKRQISIVQCLQGPDKLQIRDSVPGLSVGDSYYAEIRHVDDPFRPVSYWYSMEMWDWQTFSLSATDYRFYPIEAIEVDGEPVDSFLWR